MIFYNSCLDRKLDTGDEFFLMEDKKLLCKHDYETAKSKGGEKDLLVFFSSMMSANLTLNRIEQMTNVDAMDRGCAKKFRQ